MNRATLLRFLAQAAVWGTSFSFIKISLEGLAPGQIVLVRLILGALVLTAVARLRGVTLRMPPKLWGHQLVAAILANVAPYLLLSYGERDTGAGVAGVLVAGTPLITLLIATLALADEKTNWRRSVGFLLGFVGVAVVIAPWHDQLGSTAARFACFGAAVCYALGYVYCRRFLSGAGVEPLTLATTQLIAAVVPIALAAPLLGWRDPSLNIRVVLAVVCLGALSTGFANILYFRLIKDVGATLAAAVDYVVPFFAVLFGFLLLREAPAWNLLVGGVVVLAGMYLAEGRLPSRLRRTQQVPVSVPVPALPVVAPEEQPVALDCAEAARS